MDASAYSRRAAIADSAWAAQDSFRTGLGRMLGLVAWPFERVAYSLQERLVWPAEDRAATMGTPARTLSFAGVVLLAAGVGVAGLIWAAPDGPHRAAAPEAAAPTALAAAAAAPQNSAEPTLQGAAPVFEPAGKGAPSEVDPAKAVVKSSPADSAASAPSAATPAAATSSSSAGASPQAGSGDGPPAGPEALSVARDFAGAFVVYETGGVDSDVRRAFGETATRDLARALLRRPPRLPANVEVPKAKVVNVVPAPSRGGIYPVSVSLLRVGLTSELRLDMEQLKGKRWRVTNVLG